jgi:hypothetical protein
MNLLKTLRLVLMINLLVIFLQFFFAGQMLGGSSIAVNLHGVTGLFLLIIATVQIAIAVAMRRIGMCPTWLVASNAGLILAEVIEAVCGHFHILALHVPLALAIFSAVARQIYWATREAGSVSEASA